MLKVILGLFTNDISIISIIISVSFFSGYIVFNLKNLNKQVTNHIPTQIKEISNKIDSNYKELSNKIDSDYKELSNKIDEKFDKLYKILLEKK